MAEIYVEVKVVGTEKYCVKEKNLEEAKRILNNGDSTKYDLVEQDLEFVQETFQEY